MVSAGWLGGWGIMIHWHDHGVMAADTNDRTQDPSYGDRIGFDGDWTLNDVIIGCRFTARLARFKDIFRAGHCSFKF